jgi:hypothetical protein
MAMTELFRSVGRFLKHGNSLSAWARLAPLAALHLGAFITLYLTEYGIFGQALFLLTWAFLNFLWITLLRRPALAALLSLAMVEAVVVLSQFKFGILEMTASFFDFLIVDADTIAFLLMIFPDLRIYLVMAALVAIPAAILIWRSDRLRVRRRIATLGALACLAAMIALSSAVPEEPWEPYQGINHISNFTRSGVLSISELMAHGWLESAPTTTERLRMDANGTCTAAGKRPNIILVLDESGFDITDAPGIKVPSDYQEHFRSLDGRFRRLLVEATGGPTVYTEYNVLTGLSARSYGRFMFNVTRIAAERVERGLPRALARCGYKTVTLFPALGAFLSARRFQMGTGVERFIDLKAMGADSDLQPDRFFYEQALKVLDSDTSGQPLFIFVYVAANHFPWSWAFRPDLTPDWEGLGNTPEIDEYIRRQIMSARDYADFRDQLAQKRPNEPFLIVRFGDHQPAISTQILEPTLDAAAVRRRIAAYDPKYFTTYYTVDALNFVPLNLSSALDTLDAAYLPLAIQDLAGLPLDPSFIEQESILRRCNGLFYACAGGAEARRFNRLLIDAGLIKNL